MDTLESYALQQCLYFVSWVGFATLSLNLDVSKGSTKSGIFEIDIETNDDLIVKR